MDSSTVSISPEGQGASLAALTSHHKTPTQRRNRAQLSCTQCRQGKLKCDRKEPCSQCVKKGRASLCTIPIPAPRRKPAVSMQNRLRHLESLVKNVMAGQTPAPVTPHSGTSSDTDQPMGESPKPRMQRQQSDAENSGHSLNGRPLPSSSGQVLLGTNESSTYVGATHWAAILEDIEDVKDYFDGVEAEDIVDGGDIIPYATLSFNAQSPVTKNDLLVALPERLAVDRLVSDFFNSNSHSLHLLHKPTFQKQYTQFWADPDGAPVIWIGLLYSIMLVSAFAKLSCGSESHSPGSGTNPMDAIHKYRNCCIHALIISYYTKPGPYTMETLCIFMEGEFLISHDGQVHLYLLVGNCIRLALRMGLHRDSSKVEGDISPFQAEFRRRIWHHLAQIDLLSSFHIGLPGMIHAIESDTAFPRNLRDEDFDENSDELPQSRPETEFTSTSYLVCKSRLSHESGKIVALANSLTEHPYEEVNKLDALLVEAYKTVPVFYKIGPSGLSILDPPAIVIKQFGLTLLFQKSRCMLHRRYLAKDNGCHEYSKSRKIALDASMALLKAQSMCHDASLPGGLLDNDKWFLSTISMHDFLLAAMIICMSILRAVDGGLNAENIMHEDRQDDWNKLVALEKSYEIWTKTQGLADAPKAVSLVRAMLKKVNAALKYPSGKSMVATSNGAGGNETSRTNFISQLSLEDSSALYATSIQGFQPQDLWQPEMSGTISSFSGTTTQSNQQATLVTVDPIGELIENNFNWETFDDHIFPKSSFDQAWPNVNADDFGYGEFNYDVFGNN
ncbi:fungal-specific transcription factor domain-containing protein [Tricladium varicosporioides]|nr:fungal-specific transcription factor domain-containing protein [Hymenoscyphus varicosporioides]